MAQEQINIGAAPNDGTGDPLRDGGSKINGNFTELYAAVAAISGDLNSGSPFNGVVNGCGVAYSGSGLTFLMTAGSYYIDGTLYDAAAQSVTLDAADATNPRIDVLFVDDAGVFDKITGVPAANPSQPAVDPTTQLYLSFVLVPATATDIDEITTEVIYDEGAEWTATESGTGFTIDSTNNPHTGTKDIEATTVPSGDYVEFARASDVAFGGDGSLYFRIRSKATWNAKRTLTFQWYKDGVAVGLPITFKHNTYGFDSSITASYQLVVIPKSVFAIPSVDLVDKLRITVGGSGGAAIGFYLDTVTLQTNGEGTGGGGGSSSGMTQEQADARYVKKEEMPAYGMAVVSTDADDYTVLATHNNRYIRLTAAGTKNITVQDQADQALPDNGEWHFRNVGAGAATFVEDTSVTINPPADGTLVVPERGTVTLKRVAADEFDLIGVTVPA